MRLDPARSTLETALSLSRRLAGYTSSRAGPTASHTAVWCIDIIETSGRVWGGETAPTWPDQAGPGRTIAHSLPRAPQCMCPRAASIRSARVCLHARAESHTQPYHVLIVTDTHARTHTHVWGRETHTHTRWNGGRGGCILKNMHTLTREGGREGGGGEGGGVDRRLRPFAPLRPSWALAPPSPPHTVCFLAPRAPSLHPRFPVGLFPHPSPLVRFLASRLSAHPRSPLALRSPLDSPCLAPHHSLPPHSPPSLRPCSPLTPPSLTP